MFLRMAAVLLEGEGEGVKGLGALPERTERGRHGSMNLSNGTARSRRSPKDWSLAGLQACRQDRQMQGQGSARTEALGSGHYQGADHQMSRPACYIPITRRLRYHLNRPRALPPTWILQGLPPMYQYQRAGVTKALMSPLVMVLILIPVLVL
jgi:hypothetical protein